MGSVYKAWETSLCDLSSEKQKRPALKAQRTERVGWHASVSEQAFALGV